MNKIDRMKIAFVKSLKLCAIYGSLLVGIFLCVAVLLEAFEASLAIGVIVGAIYCIIGVAVYYYFD